MKARSNENTKPPESQSHSRGSQEGAPAAQTETQIQSPGGSPRDGELSKYAALQSELVGQVRALSLLHEQRGSFSSKADVLKAERTTLEARVLDGDNQAIADIVQNGDALALNEVKLSALAVRIGRLESELHGKLPLALETFGRLRSFVVRETLEACRTAVANLIAPDYSVAPEHLDAVAIAMPAYVKVSRIQIPAPSFAWNQPLDPVELHWNSLTRPRTSQERAALRSEVVQSLVRAANELVLAARGLLEAATPYAQGDVPPFRCEPEPVVVATVDPKFLEWQQPLGGSDAEWLAKICQEGGKPYPPTDPAQIEILNRMLEQRHAHPIAHAVWSGEMFGSTQAA